MARLTPIQGPALALALLAPAHSPADAGPGGKPPLPMSDVADRIIEAQLPPLKLEPDGEVGGAAGKTQVVRRASAMGVNPESTLALGRNAGRDIDRLLKPRTPPPEGPPIAFQGRTLSELNQHLADRRTIKVLSPELIADEQLRIKNRGDLHIDFGNARILGPPTGFAEDRYTAALIIENSRNVSVSGGTFSGIEAITVSESSHVAIQNTAILDAPGYGIIIAPANTNIVVSGASILRPKASGITVLGKSTGILIYGNTVSGAEGTSNLHAGILITDRRLYQRIGGVNFLLSPGYTRGGTPVLHYPPGDPIPHRTPADHVYLIGNSIFGNLASGIYLDGATLVYARSNRIHGNSKEGICLDGGSAGNIIFGNAIAANGKRWGQSDRDLDADFVLGFGRGNDGDSTAKLPGVSIDNAAFNILANNYISGNYGSGIKMVRTAYYNLVGHNQIEANNIGANATHHFFGIEIGGAPADAPADDLDFTASMGNIIYQNIISGSHYAGIQFCPECDFNDVFDNLIIRPHTWAIEQTSRSGKNIFANNFSQAPSRNAHLNGSSGRILTGGDGRFD